jgi:hypothetical protein
LAEKHYYNFWCPNRGAEISTWGRQAESLRLLLVACRSYERTPKPGLFANAIKNYRKASELNWEIVTRHPSWSLARVLPRLIKRIDEVDEEEIARKFERLMQGNNDSITSFCDRFNEAANAYRILFELPEKQEMDKFMTTLRVGNQKQLKLLRIEKDCIEDIFDVIQTFETSQGIGQRH